MSRLPAAPRRLSRVDLWTLRLGSWSLFLGLSMATLVSLLGWTLVAAYGVKFSSLRHLLKAHEVVVGRVESSALDRLWSGEPVFRTTALFQLDSSTHRAVGYGVPNPPLAQGQQVDILLDKDEPGFAWIHGLDPYPIRLSLLLKGGLVGLTPGLILILTGLAQGRRESRLVQTGACVTGRRGRHLSLPRPFSSLYLSRYYTNGEFFSTWSVGPDVGDTPELLWASKGKPAVVAHLFPRLQIDRDSVSGLSYTRRFRFISVIGLGLVQAVLLLGFLLT